MKKRKPKGKTILTVTVTDSGEFIDIKTKFEGNPLFGMNPDTLLVGIQRQLIQAFDQALERNTDDV